MNCIVVLCDTLRRDHCGPYHHGRPLDEIQSAEQPDWTVPTPNMDRLAERGTTFDPAYHGSTPCMPARRDIYTGRYEFLERGWGPLEENDRDLPREVSGDPNSAIAGLESDGMSVSQLITDHYHPWEQDSGNYHFGYTGFEFVRGHESDNWCIEPIEFDSPEEPESRLQRHWRNLASVSGDRPTTDGVPDDEPDHFGTRVFDEAADWIDRNHDREDFTSTSTVSTLTSRSGRRRIS